MDEGLAESLTRLESLVSELGKRQRRFKQENEQLHGLVTAMEEKSRKAERLTADHERLLKDRERLKAKVQELLEKFEKLHL